MDEKKQEVMEKIAKLLTLAEDQSGKPEGESARAFASKLMAKYRIAESEIDLGQDGNGIFHDEDGWEGLNDQGGKRQWVADLAWYLADTFDCRNYISTYRGTVHFIGTEGDIETVLYFMDIVFGHIEKEARKICPKPEQYRKRNVFGQAAVLVIRDRLAELKATMKKEVAEYSGGYELMVVKGDLVNKTAEDYFGKQGMKNARNTSVNSQDRRLILAGMTAGRTAPLNRALEG